LTLYYFAYGSNMHPLRLAQRVPSSTPLGTAELPGYMLRFHKVGGDGSGKCNVEHTGRDHDRVLGVVYRLLAIEKPLLDKAEGVGFGYELEAQEIQFRGASREVFYYVAQATHIDDSLQPFHWYKDLVVAGARTHGLPRHYVSELDRITSVADPDHERTHQHRRILSDGAFR